MGYKHQVGKGAFATVYKAQALGQAAAEGRNVVAVKVRAPQ